MDISRSVSKTILTIFSFVVLTACNTANQEAALTMVVQTFEARGTVAAATQTGGTEIALADIAEATEIAHAEVMKATSIALTEIANATATPVMTSTPTPDPNRDVLAEIGEARKMTFYASSARWGKEYTDGSVMSLMAEGDSYVVIWSAAKNGNWLVGNVVKRIQVIVNALDFPEPMFETIVNDVITDWQHFNKSSNNEEQYRHNGYEIVIYEDKSNAAFHPTTPFNGGGFHIVIRVRKDVVTSSTPDQESIVYLADIEPELIAAYKDHFWVRQSGRNSINFPVDLSGTVYKNGLSIEGGSDYLDEDPSILIYDLNGEYSSFNTSMVLERVIFDDAVLCGSGNKFSVYLDDEKVYETTIRAWTGFPINITLDVTDVSKLMLQTIHLSNVSDCASIWGDPYLVIVNADAPKPTTGDIEGRVYWASTGGPVKGVILGLGDTEVTSDADGQYAFEGLSAGSYSFTLRWEFDFDGGDTPCAGLDAATMIAGDWFTNLITLNAGGRMVVAIQNDGIEIKASEGTTFDIVFSCSD